MKTELNLTPNEAALLARCLSDSAKAVTKIEKSASEFRVYYRYLGGLGSSAICYSLVGSMIDTLEEIKRLEKSLGFRKRA